jgi:hypothetical protein
MQKLVEGKFPAVNGRLRWRFGIWFEVLGLE